MSVSGCWEGPVVDWKGRLRCRVICWLSGRRCLLWRSPAVGRGKANGLVGLGGGVQVSFWMEFGGILGIEE